MWASILKTLSNPTVVALAVAGLGWVWSKISKSTVDSNATIQHALAAARSVMSSIVQTVAPTIPLDDLKSKLAQAAYDALDHVGIKSTSLSPLVAAMINAAVAEFINEFVASHSQKPTLAQSVIAIAKIPAATAAA